MFWRKKAAPAPEEPAGPKLAAASEKMASSITSLEERIRACDADILKFKRGEISKASAMNALRRRKMLEQQLEQLYATHGAVEQIQFAVESAETTQLAVKAMRQTMNAADLLPKMDEVESLAEEMADFMEDQREFADILRPQGNFVDDAELEAEFASLEAEVSKESVYLPAAPSSLPVRQAQTEK